MKNYSVYKIVSLTDTSYKEVILQVDEKIEIKKLEEIKKGMSGEISVIYLTSFSAKEGGEFTILHTSTVLSTPYGELDVLD